MTKTSPTFVRFETQEGPRWVNPANISYFGTFHTGSSTEMTFTMGAELILVKVSPEEVAAKLMGDCIATTKTWRDLAIDMADSAEYSDRHENARKRVRELEKQETQQIVAAKLRGEGNDTEVLANVKTLCELLYKSTKDDEPDGARVCATLLDYINNPVPTEAQHTDE